MKRYSLEINGKVQGVGFRYFSQLTATKFLLTGYVKNLYSGDIFIEIQGKQEHIDKFIDTILMGNRLSKIYNINFNEIPIVCGEKNFTIKY